jgi:hypothetical protein
MPKPCPSCAATTEEWWSYCAMCGHHIAGGKRLLVLTPVEPRRDANGDFSPGDEVHDAFMAFDPDNPDVPLD